MRKIFFTVILFMLFCAWEVYADSSTNCSYRGSILHCDTRDRNMFSDQIAQSANQAQQNGIQIALQRAQWAQLQLIQQQTALIEAQRNQYRQRNDPDEYILSGQYMNDQNNQRN